MTDEHRVAPAPKGLDPSMIAEGAAGSPSAGVERAAPPDTDPAPVSAADLAAAPIPSATPIPPPDASVGDGGAALALAPQRETRRRARMLRIPDDEVARPQSSPIIEGASSPLRADGEGAVLTPMRIITISEPPPARSLSSKPPGASVPAPAQPRTPTRPSPEIAVSPLEKAQPVRPPIESEELIPIHTDPSEPGVARFDPPPSEDVISDRPTPVAPLPMGDDSSPGSDEELALEDDILTPRAPHLETRAERWTRSSDRASDSASEISSDDLVPIEPPVAPPKVPGATPPVRPRFQSQPPKGSVPPRHPAKAPLVIVPPHVGTMAPQSTEGSGSRRKGRLWWEELFNDDYLRTCERLSDEQLAREVDFIEDRLSIERGGAVMDLACGTGLHAIELAHRGYEVVGFDLSLAMLARAGEEAQDRETKLNFVQGDMREMTFEEQFDGVYCWNTSFGYFEEDKNAQVIDRIHRSLKAGGLLLLDVANRDFLMRQSPSLAWFEGDGCVCMDEMTMDFITSRMKIKRTMMLDDGRSREIEYSMRVYSLHELGRILHEHRFKVCEVSGRTATPGVFFGNESPRTIILAEKR